MDNMVRVNIDNNENESAGLDDHLGRCQQGLYFNAKLPINIKQPT